MAAPRPVGVRLPRPTRLEGFSDAVFAIVLTLLVLDLLPGDEPRSPAQLLAAWPGYLAYLTTFVTVSAIWLTHHGIFARVARVDAAVLAGNLVILLGASALPWPTALVSVALGDDDRPAAIAGVAIMAVCSCLLGGGMAIVIRHLALRPALVTSEAETGWLRRQAGYALATLPVSGAAVALAFPSPVAALCLFLIVPLLFIVLSLRDGGPAAFGD